MVERLVGVIEQIRHPFVIEMLLETDAKIIAFEPHPQLLLPTDNILAKATYVSLEVINSASVFTST